VYFKIEKIRLKPEDIIADVALLFLAGIDITATT